MATLIDTLKRDNRLGTRKRRIGQTSRSSASRSGFA